MAIGVAAAELLIKLRTAGYLEPGAAVIEIGAQQLSRSFLGVPDRIAYLGSLFGVTQPLRLEQPADSEAEEDWAILTAPFARQFWRWLGFQYASVDIDGSPGSIPLDLNFDTVPVEAKGKYQLVTNFGTTEHVANQLNAFKVVHDLTAPNGVMIHEVPVQGMVNHGLINYNFKFFWMLARSNGYKSVYANFMPAEGSSDLPDNIVEYLNDATLTAEQSSLDYKVRDAGILVALQKSVDIPFVPPLDVTTGVSTDDESLKKRYWTVFDPEALDRLQPRDTRKNGGLARPLPRNAVAAETPPGRDEQQSSNPEPQHTNSQVSVMSNSRPQMTPVHAERSPASVSLPAKLGSLFMGWARMGRNVAGTAQGIANQTAVINERVTELLVGIANQSELINESKEKSDAIAIAIANQTDLLRQKLDALTRVMHELRQIQKAQLAMQREASEAIMQYGMAEPGPDQQSRTAEFPAAPGASKPPLKS